MSESVASLAMRTQTIQLLRDGYYRLCEAYMNGAIDKHQYNVVLVNIDRLMETLLGIDGIAGTRNVAPVTISAVAPPTSTTASPTSTTATESPTPAPTPPAGQPPGLNIGTVTVTPPGAVQSEAIANIVLAANSGTSFPALCISLLASGEMDPNNPGQRSVLKRCDYLLHGAAYRYLTSRVPVHPTPTRYQVSPNAAAAQVNKCPIGPDGKPLPSCS